MIAAPVDLGSILVVMLVGGLASFGGGMGPVAVIQGTWVAGGQLEPSLFAWVLALSHLTPGPRAGFIAGIGYYLHGVSGSVVAMAGVLMPAWIAAAGAVTGLELKSCPIRFRWDHPKQTLKLSDTLNLDHLVPICQSRIITVFLWTVSLTRQHNRHIP